MDSARQALWVRTKGILSDDQALHTYNALNFLEKVRVNTNSIVFLKGQYINAIVMFAVLDKCKSENS